jgi:hypothetical protein
MKRRANQWEQCKVCYKRVALERAELVDRKRVRRKEERKVTVYEIKIK